MKDSIVMTVFNREPEVLMNTLRWLSNCNLDESEVIIVDDLSTIPYEWVDAYKQVMPIRWVTMDPYESHKTPAGYKNPAKAFNRCLLEAQGEHIVILSSDVIVPSRVLEASRKITDAVYCPMVIDLDSSMEYCGPHRPFPMPWFLRCKTEDARACGGWDENYMLGLCYEDNDFVGRLALLTKRFVYDWTSVVWHQSHVQPAYNVEDQWIALANKRNRELTMTKWTGMPFGDADLPAFGSSKSRHEHGHQMMTFEDIKNVYEKVVSETRSPFVAEKVPQ